MNEFQEEVVDILKNKAAELFGVDAESLSAETSFVDDLHCKSVNIVQFASALEGTSTRSRSPTCSSTSARPLPTPPSSWTTPSPCSEQGPTEPSFSAAVGPFFYRKDLT